MDCSTGIYLITHIASGFPYVGLTGRQLNRNSEPFGFEGRWEEHRYHLRKNNYANSSVKLQNYWNKYGERAFRFSVHTKIPKGKLTEKEFYALLRKEEARVLALFPNNLNCTEAGDGGMRRTKSSIEKQKAKLSDTRATNPNYREQVSIQIRKMWQNPETRAKLIAERKTRKHSKATKLKMSISGKLAHGTPEARAAISKLNKGRIRTPEVRAKISKALKDQCSTPEGRSKMLQMSKLAHSPEARPNNGFKGRNHASGSRSKIGETLRKRFGGRKILLRQIKEHWKL